MKQKKIVDACAEKAVFYENKTNSLKIKDIFSCVFVSSV